MGASATKPLSSGDPIKHPWRTYEDGTLDYRADDIASVDEIFLAYLAEMMADRCTVQNHSIHIWYRRDGIAVDGIYGFHRIFFLGPPGTSRTRLVDCTRPSIPVSEVLARVMRDAKDTGKRFTVVPVVKKFMRDDSGTYFGHSVLILFDHHAKRWIHLDPGNNPSYFSLYKLRWAQDHDVSTMNALDLAFDQAEYAEAMLGPGMSLLGSMWHVNRFFDQISPRSHGFGHCIPLASYVMHALIKYMPYFDEVGMSDEVMDAFVVHFICRSFSSIHPPPLDYLRGLLPGGEADEGGAQVMMRAARDQMALALKRKPDAGHADVWFGGGSAFAKECIDDKRPWTKLMEFASTVLVDFLDRALRRLRDPSVTLDRWVLLPDDNGKVTDEQEKEEGVVYVQSKKARGLFCNVFYISGSLQHQVPAQAPALRAEDRRLAKRLRFVRAEDEDDDGGKVGGGEM